MMTIAEARALFVAALEAIAPSAAPSSRSSVRTADDLLDWVGRADVRSLLGTLSDAERNDLRLVLDGMLRERARA